MAEVTEVREVQAEKPEGMTLSDVLGKDVDQLKSVLAGGSEAEAEAEAVVVEGAEEAGEASDDLKGQEELTAEQEAEAEAEKKEEAGEEEKEKEAGEAESVALSLASREEAGEPDVIDFDVEDDETREGLAVVQRRLDEGEMLRSQADSVREAVFETEEREAKVQYIEDRMKVDPSGFLLEQVTDPVKQEILLDLMLDDESFKFVTEKIEEWGDSRGQRRVDAAERKADRTARSAEAEKELREDTENRERARAIGEALQGLIPDDFPLEEADEFYVEALVVLKQQIKARGRAFKPEDVEAALEKKLKRYGIAPAQTNGKGADRKLADRAKSAEETGKRFVARRKKKQAAASAPGGVGVAPAAVGPPKGATLEEASKWARANLRKG